MSHAVVVDRAPGATGGEVVLRRVGPHFEIISNGVFLMDTRDGRSEAAMVTRAMDRAGHRTGGLHVVIAGLGVGFSARRALDHPALRRLSVVELEPKVIEWHRGPLREVVGSLEADPRCRLECGDMVAWISAAYARGERFDVVCMDTDNGPDWTVVEDNAWLYEESALTLLAACLEPGGVVAFWSAARAPDFADRLRRHFADVSDFEVPVERGTPDVVYLATTSGGPMPDPVG
jgi:spermidine synthase